MADRIRLAISTCPNDTYAFHALMHGLIDLRGVQFDIELLDIEQLNQKLFEQTADVIKVSFAAALHAAEDYWVLPSGSALGYGVGPLLLSSQPDTCPQTAGQLTLCPGFHTTAHHLFQHFYPATTRVEQVVFSQVMPLLQTGQADFGVCIHEGRFTWKTAGLHLIEDLGSRWEQATSCPLPLGGILANRKLGNDLAHRVQMTLLDSIRYAHENVPSVLPTMRKHAQEFDDRVLMQHVELYVNEWTLDLGSQGHQALRELSRRFQTENSRPAELQILP